MQSVGGAAAKELLQQPLEPSVQKSVRFEIASTPEIICPPNPNAESSDCLPESVLGTATPQLWRAVDAGDAAALRGLISAGACRADARDTLGYSVLWRLISLGHVGLALLVVDGCPFGGADAAEEDPLQRDTLLHLLCRAAHFAAEAAELFKRIAGRLAARQMTRRNVAGESFLDVAAAFANFWVLRFVLHSFPAVSKELLQGAAAATGHGSPPLRSLVKRLAQPRPPESRPLERWPRHLDLSHMLQPDATGVVPYADLAFEVCANTPAGSAQPGRSEASAKGLFLAHRVIMSSRSPSLHEELQKHSPGPLPGHEELCMCIFRVDTRITKEVWRCVLHFCYSGEVVSGLLGDIRQLTELLRACVLYKLPVPLLEFAQAELCPMLPMAPPHALLEVFSIVEPTDGRLAPMREASAYWLLHNAHDLFKKLDPEDACPVLRRVLRAVEAPICRLFVD